MASSYSAFFNSNDTLLFYEDYPCDNPNAPVLLFLHGNGEDHTYFSHQISHFSKDFRLILMDTRAQGQSSRGKTKLDFSIFSDDLLCLMDTLHIQKAHLLGFSDGGNIALTFALSHPHRVESLILNGANLFPTGMYSKVYLSILLEYAVKIPISIFSKKAKHDCELLGLMVHHPHISPKELKSLHIPSLVIVGEYDMIKDQHSRMIAQMIPDSQFICLKDADHFCAFKHPQEFNAAVSKFLHSL